MGPQTASLGEDEKLKHELDKQQITAVLSDQLKTENNVITGAHF